LIVNKKVNNYFDFMFFAYIFTVMKQKLIFLPAVLAMFVIMSCGDNASTDTKVTSKDTVLIVAPTGSIGTKCDSIQKKVDSLLNKK
jgi:hypothetical protein